MNASYRHSQYVAHLDASQHNKEGPSYAVLTKYPPMPLLLSYLF
jgi:hypothetical protein